STRELPLALAGRGARMERFAAERADWVLLAGRSVTTVPELVARLRQLGEAARGRPSAIAWNPVAAWADAMRDGLPSPLAYIAAAMPSAERGALGLDAARTAELRTIINRRGLDAASAMISDDVLERYAIVGDRERVVVRLSEVWREVMPELLVFDAHDYS